MPVQEYRQRNGWRGGFLFVGNQLILDFLNTRPVQDERPRELLPNFAALLRWFQAAGLLDARQSAGLQRKWGRSVRAQRTLRTLRGWRERLRKEVLAWEAGGSLQPATQEELNRLMALYPMRDRLKIDGTSAWIEQWFESRQPEDLLAPLTYSATQLFSEANRTRVHKCGGCILHFYDTSRKGTRRWCSMQLCGNRLKVAAYAARRQRRRLGGKEDVLSDE